MTSTDPAPDGRHTTPAGWSSVDAPISTSPVPEPPAPPAPAGPVWITGPNPAAIVVGLLCIVAGALTIAHVLTGFTLDWGKTGPGVFTGLGVALVVIGAIGIVRRRRRCG